MQISLKQREIENAIRAYISAQGINLTGKDVTIDFTAGRSQSGLTADINIEEAGVGAQSPQPLGGVNTTTNDQAKKSEPVLTGKAAEAKTAPDPTPYPTRETEPEVGLALTDEASTVAAPAAPKSSLFNA
jgi:hypothetical protein